MQLHARELAQTERHAAAEALLLDPLQACEVQKVGQHAQALPLCLSVDDLCAVIPLQAMASRDCLRRHRQHNAQLPAVPLTVPS